MIKYIIVFKVCSILYGECMPELQPRVTFNSWYNCAQFGLSETSNYLDNIGEKMVNENKIMVSFTCNKINES